MAEQASATRVEPKAASSAAIGSTSRPPSVWRLGGLTLKQLAGLAGLVISAHLPFIVYLTRGAAPVTASVPFSDDFERTEIGPSYFAIGGHWRIEKGVLHSPGVKNNPLWLQARLPDDVAVELDVRSESNEGDIKCEIFGNGRDHASGYIVVFGGWSNSISVLARLDEHGRDRKENRSLRVQKGKTYHVRIERKGGMLSWYLDSALVLQWDDPAPLRGPGHDRFGFSSWEADLFFDNLKIQPL